MLFTLSFFLELYLHSEGFETISCSNLSINMIEILEHVIVWNPSSSAKKELTNLITHVQHKIDK